MFFPFTSNERNKIVYIFAFPLLVSSSSFRMLVLWYLKYFMTPILLKDFLLLVNIVGEFYRGDHFSKILHSGN